MYMCICMCVYVCVRATVSVRKFVLRNQAKFHY